MLDASYSININQTYFNKTNPTDNKNLDNTKQIEQIETMKGGLFEGEKGLELLTLLLELIMQLIQSLVNQEEEDLSGNNSSLGEANHPSGESGNGLTNPIEEALRHNLFMSLLTDDSFDVIGSGYDLFSDEDDEIPYYI